MSTKKSKKTVAKNKFNTVVNTAKGTVKKANDVALNTTENVISESFTVVEQWQKISTKAIKGGFKLASNQQDIVFDALDTFKGQFMQGKKRFTKLFA